MEKLKNNDVFSLARRVHMDFHTPDIAWKRAMKEFDAKEYVQILKEANLNSLVSFTKCHHGYSYYNTQIGLRHPSLPEGVDMFGEILSECHANDMKVLAYYSIGWLTTIQKNKPEWMEINIKGENLDTSGRPISGPWANICLNSPYLQEVVLPELREIITQYDADGLWLDIIECNPCHCEYCKNKYFAQYHEPLPEDDTLLKDFVVQTKFDFINTCRALLESLKPEWTFTYNTAGRDKELVKLVDFCSIETHPGAPEDKDAWTRALLTYKFLQKYRKPWETCTSRFIHGWGGWDDQPLENMLVAGSRIVSHGGMINLGDQAYPNGKLDMELYKKIGAYFEFLAQRDEKAIGATSVPYVGVLTTRFDIYAAQNDSYFGVVRILTQKHYAYDILDESMHKEFGKYECIILPEVGELQETTVQAIQQYVDNGGVILATGDSSYSNNRLMLGDIFGCEFLEKSQYSTSYFKVADEIGENVRRSPIMIPESVDIVKPSDNVTILADVYNPVIEPNYDEFMIFRNQYFSPPADKAYNPGIVEHKYGKGCSVYIPSNIFTAFQKHEQWYLADVVGNILERIIKDKRIVLEAPSTVEMNVTEKEQELICHLIQYQTQNASYHVREILPVYNLKLKVSLELVKAEKPMIYPSQQQLEYKIEEHYIEVVIPKLEIYEQIVFIK